MVDASRGSAAEPTEAGSLLSLRRKRVLLLSFLCNPCIARYSLSISSVIFSGGPPIHLEGDSGAGVLPCRGKLVLICPGSQRWTPSPKGLTVSPGPGPPPSQCRVSPPVHQAEMAGWIIPGLEGVLEAGSGKILALEPSRVHIKGPSKTKTQDNIPQGG